MANRERGEVYVDVDGKTYTLVLTINAICELEDLLSTAEKPVTMQDIEARVARGSIRHIRAFVWAAMRQYHADMTVTQVGEWIQRVGMAALMGRVNEMTAAAQPDPKDVKALGIKPSRPQKAQVQRGGTGGSSTLTRAASA